MISGYPLTERMLRMKSLITCIRFLILSQCIIGFLAVTVIRDNANLTSVPQGINVAVTSLFLQHNTIVTIDSGSFPLYPRLEKLFMGHNPLEEIKSGTFDNNPELQSFTCDWCSLHIFPVDFGPASKSLRKLGLTFGIKNITAFSQMRVELFTSLRRLSLYGVKATDVDIIRFPISITHLIMQSMKLTTFPKLTSDLFPNLNSVRLKYNKFQEGSNFLGMTKTVKFIYIESSNLHCADGLDLLPNLSNLDIRNNNLETIPDLLGLPIRMLYISGNSRINCDQRMCWRRLWDRMRKPIRDSGDVICVRPPLLAGSAMSSVNPKFMHCGNGKLIPSKLKNYTRDHQYFRAWLYKIAILRLYQKFPVHFQGYWCW